MMQHLIESRQIIGSILVENMLPETVYIKNYRIHHGRFTPSQWVLGKMPLEVDSVDTLTNEEADHFLGVHLDIEDGETSFARQLQLRQVAKEAFSLWTPPTGCGRLCCGSLRPGLLLQEREHKVL